MKWGIKYSAHAKNDLQDIYQYIAVTLLAPDTAYELTQAIMDAVSSLNEMRCDTVSMRSNRGNPSASGFCLSKTLWCCICRKHKATPSISSGLCTAAETSAGSTRSVVPTAVDLKSAGSVMKECCVRSLLQLLNIRCIII